MDEGKQLIVSNKLTRVHPKLPIVAALALVHRDDEFLLIRKENSPEKEFWALPGGVVELGEKTEMAIKREVCEELGMSIKVERLLNVFDDIHRSSDGEILYHYVLVCYVASPLGKCKISGNILACRWVKSAEISKVPLTEVARLSIEAYINRID